MATSQFVNQPHPLLRGLFEKRLTLFFASSSPTPAQANRLAQPRLNKRRMAGRENH